MTSDAFVRLSQKVGAPIIPFRIERLHGCYFRLSLHPTIPAEGRTAEDVIGDAHRLLEGWIAEKPGQWLWLHRRWDSAGLK
jgi:KDO2-lipid IV(A) lauroyltransferase